jgi:hypothetical protein
LNPELAVTNPDEILNATLNTLEVCITPITGIVQYNLPGSFGKLLNRCFIPKYCWKLHFIHQAMQGRDPGGVKENLLLTNI